MYKKISRLKRACLSRIKNKKLKKIRLVVFRTSRNIYAQIIFKNKTLLSASTLEKKINKNINYTGNKYAAAIIGKIIAKRCIKNGIENVIFDKSGYKYHGRIKALAEAARESGLIF
ncbi:50S ribosomal protein L18 [Enterobacterales bacterium endosymbiont of Anomoneura mori]|uniref:50S ribosomal protein L18 n=1 Tax=Enterobacterales bacterium endosymbiont of Anomoneura mori TaxID=3132096 RepID=UPI00399CC872